MTDRQTRQREMRLLLRLAVAFVSSRGRWGGNYQVGPTLLRSCELDAWPWKAELLTPRHPPSDEPLCSWIKLWFKGELVLHVKFDAERMRTIKHAPGAWVCKTPPGNRKFQP